MRHLPAIGLAGLALLTMSTGTNAVPIPTAVAVDPPQDKAFPATMRPLALPTHGVRINAVLFAAAGAAAHPTVLLLHGFPGNEQNLDIARALQRAGWNVLTLHYRGSWGSPGDYSFTHCLEDAAAALEWLRHPPADFATRIDPARIALVGHSLGGFAAGYVAGHDDGVMGVVLISSSRFGGALGKFSHADAAKLIESNLHAQDGMRPIGDATGDTLADEAIGHAAAWDLRQFAPRLSAQPLFVITADDGLAEWDEGIAGAVEAQHRAPVAREHFATDHSYNDRRIGLQATIVRWLAALPGAPRS